MCKGPAIGKMFSEQKESLCSWNEGGKVKKRKRQDFCLQGIYTIGKNSHIPNSPYYFMDL